MKENERQPNVAAVAEMTHRSRPGAIQFVIALAIAIVTTSCCPLPALADVLSTTVDLEDLTLPPESFYNGSDLAGEFISHGARFNNTFTDFGGFTSWFGWSYSNTTDVVTPGLDNQYSAYHLPTGGGDASPNFAMAFAVEPGDAFIELPDGHVPSSIRVTNSTWAAQVMLNGDSDGFAKQFGGPSGNDPDWFLLTVTGEDAQGDPVATAEIYLADYRFANNLLDFVIDTWTTLDLSGLAGSATLSFALTSSDTGMFGINTPAYVALDNLEVLLVEGDGNADGAVGPEDYTIWADGFGIGTKVTEGDYSRNGSVGAEDYPVWANNFGDTLPASVGTPSRSTMVPEPGAALLLALGASAGLLIRRKRSTPNTI